MGWNSWYDLAGDDFLAILSVIDAFSVPADEMMPRRNVPILMELSIGLAPTSKVRDLRVPLLHGSGVEEGRTDRNHRYRAWGYTMWGLTGA